MKSLKIFTQLVEVSIVTLLTITVVLLIIPIAIMKSLFKIR